MPLLLLVLFVVVPILELYVIIQVGQAIGVLPTIGLLLLDGVLGTYLLRSQGGKAWRRFNEVLAEGRIPHREVIDGALIIFGGALLLSPGFVTDAFGLLMLIPPTRVAIRKTLVAIFGRRIQAGAKIASWTINRARGPRPRPGTTPGPGPRPQAFDVEGTGHEVPSEPPPPLPPGPRP